MLPDHCSVENCELPIQNRKRRLCNTHYLRLLRHGNVHHRVIPQKEMPCTVDDCQLKRVNRGLCSKHNYRLQKFGSPHLVSVHVEKHGKSDHPLYSTWMNMRRRCSSATATRYERYGERGIRVCERWDKSFSAFLADVGERPVGQTLDRINNDGDYEPGNVRWVLNSAQQKNSGTRQDNTSGHKGVSWDNQRKKWRAYKGGRKTRVEIGAYESLAAAIAARHAATVDDPFVSCCTELETMRLSKSA